ncbi:MAG: hypothetical protein WDZ59_02255 [Pirellulales bacterium]
MRRWMELLAVPLALAAGHAAAQDRMDLDAVPRDIQFYSSLLDSVTSSPTDERISHLKHAADYLGDRGLAHEAEYLEDRAKQLRYQQQRDLDAKIADLKALRQRIDEALGRLQNPETQYVSVQAMIFDFDMATLTKSGTAAQANHPLTALGKLIAGGRGQRVVTTVSNQSEWLTSLSQASQHGMINTLSRPHVMTLIGQQASVVVQHEIPRRIKLDSGQEAVQSQWTGIRLDVTPTLESFESFRLDCELMIRDPLDRAGKATSAEQAYQIREFHVQANAKFDEGSTLLIANPLPKGPAAKPELIGAPPEPCTGCDVSACGQCPAQNVYRVIVLTPQTVQGGSIGNVFYPLTEEAVGRPLPAAHYPDRAVRR